MGKKTGSHAAMKADRELWRWMIRLWEPPPAPSSGLANTLDEAMAAFPAKDYFLAAPKWGYSPTYFHP